MTIWDHQWVCSQQISHDDTPCDTICFWKNKNYGIKRSEYKKKSKFELIMHTKIAAEHLMPRKADRSIDGLSVD